MSKKSPRLRWRLLSVCSISFKWLHADPFAGPKVEGGGWGLEAHSFPDVGPGPSAATPLEGVEDSESEAADEIPHADVA